MIKPLLIAAPVFTALILAAPAFAADTSSDIAALKAEIAALTQKIDQLEAKTGTPAKKTTKAHKKAAATTTTASTDTTTAAAKPVATIVAPAATTTASAQPPVKTNIPADEIVTKGSFPGSFHVPGTSTSVKFGGYVKLDAIADIGSGYGNSFAQFYKIPLSNAPQAQQSEQTTFGAQQSRLNFETRTATSLGELRTFIEGDFYGSSSPNGNINGYGLQLRHAFGSLGAPNAGFGQILAGQTWSNFHDENSRPESLDYVGPAGTVFERQAQVRYSHNVGDVIVSASVEAALGNNSTNTTAGATETGVTPTTVNTQGKMPDLVLRGDYNYGTGSNVNLRGIFTQVNVNHSVGTDNFTASQNGFGFAVGGHHVFDKDTILDKDSVFYSATYANGAARYIYDVNAAGNYYNTTTNSLKLEEVMAATVGYQHLWTDTLRSNIFGGVIRIDNSTAYSGTTANKFIASGHANLMWQPLPAYKTGIEYMHGYRKTESGVEGNLDRIETSFIYNF